VKSLKFAWTAEPDTSPPSDGAPSVGFAPLVHPAYLSHSLEGYGFCFHYLHSFGKGTAGPSDCVAVPCGSICICELERRTSMKDLYDSYKAWCESVRNCLRKFD
jgi:hypothetical protein